MYSLMDAHTRTRFSVNGASRTAMVCTIAIALCASDLRTRNDVGYFQRQRRSLVENIFSDELSLAENNNQRDAAISRIKEESDLQMRPSLGLWGLGLWVCATAVDGSFCAFLPQSIRLLCAAVLIIARIRRPLQSRLLQLLP